MTAGHIEPFFLDGAAGRLFLLLRAAPDAKRCVLIVPPFAEEMNKCRRQFTETAQALVDNGFAVVVPDLYGTGDSEGEFSDARWDIWKSDVSVALDWIEKVGLEPYALIGARLGCALAAEALADTQRSVAKSVFWQPVVKGRQFMTQFLRLRVAASMMEGDDQETVEGLREKSDQGRSLSIGGYELSLQLRQSVDAVDLLACVDGNIGDLQIFEVSSMGSGELSLAGRQLRKAVQGLGVQAAGERLVGDPFWTSTEIVVSRELCEATVSFVRAGTI